MMGGKRSVLSVLVFTAMSIQAACNDVSGPIPCPELVLFSQAENSARHYAGDAACQNCPGVTIGGHRFDFLADLAFEYQHSFDRGDLFDVDISNIILEPRLYAALDKPDWSVWSDIVIPIVHTSIELETTLTTSGGGFMRDRCCLRANGVADLPIQVGYTFVKGYSGEVDIFARVVAPTGKLPHGCPVVTLIGYDRWQLGGGMSGHIRVYEKNDDAAVTFYASFYATHPFDRAGTKINYQLNALLFADVRYRHWCWDVGYEYKGRDRERFDCPDRCDAPQVYANKGWSSVNYCWPVRNFPVTAGIGFEVDIGQSQNIPNFWGIWAKGSVSY